MKTVAKTGLARMALLLALMVVSGGLVYGAASYPANVVRVFVPASPGGSTDAVARVFAKHFQQSTGSAVAIVNQTGGGGIIAVQSVVTGKRDGSTLLLYHTALHVSHALKRSPFKFDQLQPLATLSVVNDVYAVRADAPYDTLKELVTYAKAQPGKVTIGSEFGGTTQVKGQALAKMASGEFRVVDAGSESKRITSLLGKQVDVISMSVASAQQFAQAGDIKVLAVLNDDPDSFSPEWPTALSQGVEANYPQVFTLYGPKRMAPELVKKFNDIMAGIVQDPAYQKSVNQIRQMPHYRGSEEAALFLAKEYAAIEQAVRKD